MVNVENLKPFPKFCYTIGMIPTSYKESLTYEEQLWWFCDFLQNTVIPTVNNNGQAVEELQNLYVELKSYVDNYFENLDVQTEINNKLDEMARDGTLQEIVASYLNTRAIFGFNTVNDLINSDNLINGSFARTLGYYAINDGGGALYKIRNVGASDINNILVIPINETLVAELVIEQNLYSKQLGIKGDNLTDETLLLNKFYEIETNATKILNEGIYLTSDTIFIKGLWRQDTQNNHNNGKIAFKFEKATIRYNGTENGCSIVFYNMFKQNIDGLSIDRTSVKNYIDFIGCWHCTISNFDIMSLGIHKDITILNNKTYETETIQHLKFVNGHTNGNVVIHPENALTSYTNGIYFDFVNFNGRNLNYIIELLGNISKQQIVFNECDLSYAEEAIFYIPEFQNGLINNSLSRCSITCYNCYFDSAIPLFYQNNQNNVIFNNIGDIEASNSSLQKSNIKLFDFMKNTSLMNMSVTSSFLPMFLVNLANNGDLKNGGLIANNPTYLFGSSHPNIQKEIVNSNSNVNGHALKMTFDNVEAISQYLVSLSAPFKSCYTAGIRMKKISGSCDIEFTFGGQSFLYTNDEIPLNEEIVLLNSKSLPFFEENANLNATVKFKNTNNLVIEVYEGAIIPGRTLLFGLPLHANCLTS